MSLLEHTMRILRRSSRGVILTFALSGSVVSQGWAQDSASHGRSALTGSVDERVRPGDDCFAYANGSWLARTTIPTGKDRWSARDEINEETRRRVASLIEDARDAPRGSLDRKVGDFRAAWLKESAIESRGLAPLRMAFDRIDRLGDKVALTSRNGLADLLRRRRTGDPAHIRRLAAERDDGRVGAGCLAIAGIVEEISPRRVDGSSLRSKRRRRT
jgi:hypothetical protein